MDLTLSIQKQDMEDIFKALDRILDIPHHGENARLKLDRIADWREGLLTLKEAMDLLVHISSHPISSQNIHGKGIGKAELIRIISTSGIERKKYAHLLEGGTSKNEIIDFIKMNISSFNLDPGGYVNARSELGRDITYIKSRIKSGKSVSAEKILEVLELANIATGQMVVFKKDERFKIGDQVVVMDSNHNRKSGEVATIPNPFQRVVRFSHGEHQVESIFNITDIEQ